MERVPPQGAPGACGGPCFCVVFAFLAWPCTGSPKVPSGTIQWLAETGEAYPPELRDEIQPRLDQLKSPQPARQKQPPQPPRPTRWQERPERRQERPTTQASQGSQDPQVSNPSPQEQAEHEKQHMELQAVVASMGQRTLAESRPAAAQPGTTPDTTKAQPAPPQEDAGTHLQPGTSHDEKTSGPTSHDGSQPLTTRVSAQTLAEVQNHRHPRLLKNRGRMPRVPASYPHMPLTT